MNKPLVSLERLKEVLDYNASTGVFVWKVALSRRIRVGGVEGTVNHEPRGGYCKICIDRRIYAAHRLAWFYTYGRWPDDELDHKNTDKVGNSINNLRECTRGENLLYRYAHSV